MATHLADVNGKSETGVLKGPYRGTAIVVGVLLIVCSVASLLSVAPLGSMLESPVDLARLAANDNSVVLAALIALVEAATGAGIAIALDDPHEVVVLVASLLLQIAGRLAGWQWPCEVVDPHLPGLHLLEVLDGE